MPPKLIPRQFLRSFVMFSSTMFNLKNKTLCGSSRERLPKVTWCSGRDQFIEKELGRLPLLPGAMNEKQETASAGRVGYRGCAF